MNDWKMDEVVRWREFLNKVEDLHPIPWRLQIGKLLENTGKDVVRAIEIAKNQLGEEYRHPFGAKPSDQDVSYWHSVINFLTERQVIDLILGDQDDDSD